MEDFQIYILQVNAGLVVFYLLYRMLFSRDTFLRIRRLFLFSIVILAFVYPLISLASWLEQGNALPGMVVGYAEMLAVKKALEKIEGTDIEKLLKAYHVI